MGAVWAHLQILVFNALRWPLLGPRGRKVPMLHTTPDSKHTLHCGRSLSHRNFRLLHSSHADPGFCRGRDGASLSELGENID